jgi:serine/threonine protein kinase
VRTFAPTPDMQITVGKAHYSFVPHPLLPPEMKEVYAIEGGEAVIYQLYDRDTHEFMALKLLKRALRGKHLIEETHRLQTCVHIPGLKLCQRICLTRSRYPQLIAIHPDLEYAILMPWIAGKSWSGVLLDRENSTFYTPDRARRLASVVAQVLSELEAHRIAHTDIAGSNVIVCDAGYSSIELLDVEHLYRPDFPHPRAQIVGTPGYCHPRLDRNGQWCAMGDRFAGAILLAEILAWADPLVRDHVTIGAESIFQQADLQKANTPAFRLVRNALQTLCPAAFPLFERAWSARTLAGCPDMKTWTRVLSSQSSEPT